MNVAKMMHLVSRRIANALGLARHAGEIEAVLASYPKSGRTWLRFMMSCYLAEAFALDPAPDLHSMFSVMPNLDMDPVRGLPAFAFAAHQPKPPLIAVSHLPHAGTTFRSYPVIFMTRDPRDVMVSAYFHATRQKHRFSGDIAAFVRDPDQGIAALTRYLNGWAGGLRRHRHVLVRYETLSADPQGEMVRILNFLGLEIRPEALRHAIAASSFQHMQELELAKGLPGHEYDRGDGESRRMRRGQVGGFADYLTPDLIAYIETACARDLTPETRAALPPLWASDPGTASGGVDGAHKATGL